MNDRINILIVSKLNYDKGSLKDILYRNNFNVLEFSPDQIEIDQLENIPEIIIADYGFDAGEKFKDIPLIYLVTQAELTKLYRSDNFVPRYYLRKPFDEASVILLINTVLKLRLLELKEQKMDKDYDLLLNEILLPVIRIFNGKITYVNDEALKTFDVVKDEIINKKYNICFNTENNSEFDGLIKRVENGLTSELWQDVELLKRDGSAISADIKLIPVNIEKGAGVHLIISDNSVLKRRENIQNTILKILQASNSSVSVEELFKFIFIIIGEIIPIRNMYIALFDRTNHLLSFPFYQDEYSEKPSDRQTGNGLTEYVIQKHKSLLLNNRQIKELISKDKIIVTGAEVKTWIGIPLLIHEDIAGVMVIKEYHEDNLIGEEEKDFLELVSFPIARVIERAINESERNAHLQQLKELNETKDKFFSIISHDLKSPFNSIMGLTEILKYQSSDLTKEETNQFIDSLYSSTRNIYNLLDNMLRFSRFQLGIMDFKPQKLNLNEVIESIIEILQGSALKKQINIKNELKKELHVWADKEMLHSIIQNLISNSIKFTKSGGEIILDAIEIGKYIKVIIKDNGVGMDEQTVNELFKLDVKKSTKGTEKEEGTGLGLILVKEFVEKCGGTIEVKSKQGSGTEFLIMLLVSNPVENKK